MGARASSDRRLGEGWGATDPHDVPKGELYERKAVVAKESPPRAGGVPLDPLPLEPGALLRLPLLVALQVADDPQDRPPGGTL